MVREISPGLWHWTARHERIGVDVSSYLLTPERVLLDPMIPDAGVEWFEEHGRPEHILLTNRHHDRDAWRLQERFGCTVHCIRNGLHELEGRGHAEAFDFGDELPGGAVVYEIDAICPDETALHFPARRALACADGVVGYGDELGFVPEQYMDDPAATKRGLRDAYRRLLDLDFDVLLLAHGTPVTAGGRDALRKFVTAGDQVLMSPEKDTLHSIVKAGAPSLSPRTWYGMPADAKVICFFQPAHKFKTRQATFGFSDRANLDDGEMWPTAFAVKELTPAVEARIGAILKQAVS